MKVGLDLTGALPYNDSTAMVTIAGVVNMGLYTATFSGTTLIENAAISSTLSFEIAANYLLMDNSAGGIIRIGCMHDTI